MGMFVALYLWLGVAPTTYTCDSSTYFGHHTPLHVEWATPDPIRRPPRDVAWGYATHPEM